MQKDGRNMAVVALSLLLAAMCCWEAQAIRQMNDAKNVHILAIGDSITEGAVPSLNTNHPYTRRLAQLLRRKFPGSRVSIHNSGVGGSGIHAVGFHKPTTLIPVAQEAFATAKRKGQQYTYAVVMLGINDLLRVGKSAEDVKQGLQQIYSMALDAGTDVIAIPPFAAPGFVAESDYKESERKKLAGLIQGIAADVNAKAGRQRMIVLDLQSGPMNFYRMDEEQRKRWLDDGLHFTQRGYNKLAQYIAAAITHGDTSRVPQALEQEATR